MLSQEQNCQNCQFSNHAGSDPLCLRNLTQRVRHGDPLGRVEHNPVDVLARIRGPIGSLCAVAVLDTRRARRVPRGISFAAHDVRAGRSCVPKNFSAVLYLSGSHCSSFVVGPVNSTGAGTLPARGSECPAENRLSRSKWYRCRRSPIWYGGSPCSLATLGACRGKRRTSRLRWPARQTRSLRADCRRKVGKRCCRIKSLAAGGNCAVQWRFRASLRVLRWFPSRVSS